MNVKIKPFGIPRFIGNFFVQIFLVFWAFIQFFPLFWVFYSSFKNNNEIISSVFALPKKFHFENYVFAWGNSIQASIGVFFKNSLIVTFISLIILTVVSLLASYAIAIYKFKFKNVILIVLIGFIGIPIYSYLIPVYYFIAKIGLLNNYLGLIFPYVAFNIPFSCLLLQSFFRTLPKELIEAARIDGSGELRIFFNIIIPISKGIISSVIIIDFIAIWNEFLFSMVIMKDDPMKTLPVGIFSLVGEHQVAWGQLFAGYIIALIPAIIIYLIFSRNIVEGLTLGSIKQ